MTTSSDTERSSSDLENPMTARIPVAVLGATGSVGQRFIQLLENHPWFRVHEVVASEKNVGRAYGEAATWRLGTPIPEATESLTIRELGADLESALVFSSLDSSVAGAAEDQYADRGCVVVSNSRNHRMDPDVPLLIPEVNADHLDAIESQRTRRSSRGYIVTNPNCSAVGLAMALAPLESQHGIDRVHVTTMQAISGAGYVGVPSYSILDNIIPNIPGEEEKIESEPRKILGRWNGSEFQISTISISAQVNRVPVIDGHLLSISVGFRNRKDLRRHFKIETLVEDTKHAIRSWMGEPQQLRLPSAPRRPLILLEDEDRPQPRLDRDRENGMVVSIGRVRPCNFLDIRMVALVHNTVRGAAGAAILNAELLQARNLLTTL